MNFRLVQIRALPSGISVKLKHNRHCQVSLSSGSDEIIGMWHVWWNTFGHLSQHISSPPSRQTAHQSSFGSSFWLFLSANCHWKFISFLLDSIWCILMRNEHSPSIGADKSVELWTCGDVVLPRWPSGNTCTPFESNLAMVAIKSFTDSAQVLSMDSLKLFECWKREICGLGECLVINCDSWGWHTSLVLGLGVFGLVDVTVDGMVGVGGPFWLLGVGLFNDILKEFSSVRPLVVNCMANGDWVDWFGAMPADWRLLL